MQAQEYLCKLSARTDFPQAHIQYLYKLKSQGFEPRVIYDIGACVLHWTKEAQRIWPNATIIAFDAIDELQYLYNVTGVQHYIGVLSDEDDKPVHFYQNLEYPTGSSYYREMSEMSDIIFPENEYIVKQSKTLDTVVREHMFPKPDLMKLDVQGAEIDILRGATSVLSHAQHLIAELQHQEYNKHALKADQSIPIIESMGWRCVAPLFCNNGPDGDYGFSKDC